MNDVCNEILSSYMIRKSYNDKTRFIDFMKSRFEGVTVESSGRIIKNRNLVLGDAESAKIIFTAHYDTCARLPFPNFLAPKNPLLTTLYQLLLTAAFFLVFIPIGAAAGFIAAKLQSEVLAGVLPSMAGTLCCAAVLLLFYGPVANPSTANDNTSGVVTLCELYFSLSAAEREQCAFVFLDNEEIGLVGSSRFAAKHKKAIRSKPAVNFDCVSDGDHIMFILSRKAEKAGVFGTVKDEQAQGKHITVESSRRTLYPSDQLNFPISAGVAAFNRKKYVGYYIDKIHTPRDRVFDEKNIETIVNVCRELVSASNGSKASRPENDSRKG